jgi:2-iminobutanoate/2-iminopropanoate deaminase
MMKRKSIYVEGFGHGTNPTPAACSGGGLLVSGALFGMDPQTQKLAEGQQAQCDLMFSVAQRVLEAGGTTWDGVLKMNFFITPDFPREMINSHWLRLFSDPKSRPARHVVTTNSLPPGMHLQCDITALTGDKA